jgi:hypothetical protein
MASVAGAPSSQRADAPASPFATLRVALQGVLAWNDDLLDDQQDGGGGGNRDESAEQSE